MLALTGPVPEMKSVHTGPYGQGFNWRSSTHLYCVCVLKKKVTVGAFHLNAFKDLDKELTDTLKEDINFNSYMYQLVFGKKK